MAVSGRSCAGLDRTLRPNHCATVVLAPFGGLLAFHGASSGTLLEPQRRQQ
jgi:hypothetical protein